MTTIITTRITRMTITTITTMPMTTAIMRITTVTTINNDIGVFSVIFYFLLVVVGCFCGLLFIFHFFGVLSTW